MFLTICSASVSFTNVNTQHGYHLHAGKPQLVFIGYWVCNKGFVIIFTLMKSFPDALYQHITQMQIIPFITLVKSYFFN